MIAIGGRGPDRAAGCPIGVYGEGAVQWQKCHVLSGVDPDHEAFEWRLARVRLFLERLAADEYCDAFTIGPRLGQHRLVIREAVITVAKNPDPRVWDRYASIERRDPDQRVVHAQFGVDLVRCDFHEEVPVLRAYRQGRLVLVFIEVAPAAHAEWCGMRLETTSQNTGLPAQQIADPGRH